MNATSFFISGITPTNLEKITSGLLAIEGAKPLQKDKITGLYVFVCIAISSPEEIAAKAASVVSGTGASITQANVV